MKFTLRNWRWILAIVFLLMGFSGFMSGVQATERDISNANPFTLMYYTMGLFILGGMDLGVPVGGPSWGRVLLWLAYFGAPMLTTTALIEWLQVLVANQNRWLRKLKGHTVIVGVNDLSRGVMDKLAQMSDDSRILIVDRNISETLRQEMDDRYGARCLAGNFTDEYFLRMLGISHVRRVFLASGSDFDNFETASKLLEMRPDLGQRILLHSNRLRYLREMADSEVVQSTYTFNSYHLAARHLVRTVMMKHFYETEKLDTVVIAGFGRFGQTVLEELQLIAKAEIAEIAIIDIDAHRRVLVAEEQFEMDAEFRQFVFQGHIGHPQTWQRVEESINLKSGIPLVLMVTGQDDENLRAGSWFKKRFPNAKVLVRSQRDSHFAEALSQTSGIVTFSLQQLFRESLPDDWFYELH